MSQYVRPQLRTRRGSHTLSRPLTQAELDCLLRRSPSGPTRPKREWTPSVEYELIARHLHENVREAYIAKSEAWFAAHPPKPPPAPKPVTRVDTEAVVKLLAKYGSNAPLAEWRKVGYSEEAVERIRARREWYRTHDEELQAEIERRWPGSSSSKPKKIIKAVKKKMP